MEIEKLGVSQKILTEHLSCAVHAVTEAEEQQVVARAVQLQPEAPCLAVHFLEGKPALEDILKKDTAVELLILLPFRAVLLEILLLLQLLVQLLSLLLKRALHHLPGDGL